MILDDLIDALVNLIYKIIYKLFSSICYLIDFIKTIFFKLCGIETVKIQGEDTDLLSNLLVSDNVKKVFLTITLIGVILLFVFTMMELKKAIIRKNKIGKQYYQKQDKVL